MKIGTDHICFVCLQDLSSIKKGDILLIGNGPHARYCRFVARAVVERNWPSQWHTRFPRGYIQLCDELSCIHLFDLASQTINGSPAFLFEATKVERLRRRQLALDCIVEWLDSATFGELRSLVDLLVEAFHLPPPSCRPFAQWIVEQTGGLATDDLVALAATLNTHVARDTAA
jgi:hypothetical protein